MRQRVVQSDVINADETPVRVLDPTRDSTRTGQFWTYISHGDHGYTIYDYRDSRSRDGPAEFLKDFRGYLQTDAYASYESVVLESAGRIIPVGCWAHARRNFFDARLNQPREAHYVLGLIGQLYDIEDEIRLSEPGRAASGPPGAERAGAGSPGGVLARAEGRRLAQEQVRASDRLRSEPPGPNCGGTRRMAGWRSITTRRSGRCGCARSDEKTGCSSGATKGARRRRSVSPSWPMPSAIRSSRLRMCVLC